MWRSKKLIVIALLATVLLVGGIGGGVALAQTGNGEESQPDTHHGALLERVIEIYQEKTGTAIDPDVLGAALAQARSEMWTQPQPGDRTIDPAAMQEHLKSLVDQGKITQEQADRITERWQSMTEKGEGFGFRGHGRFHGMGRPFALPKS